MGVNVHRDVCGRVTCKVLDFFQIHTVLKPSGDAGVAELMRMDGEVERLFEPTGLVLRSPSLHDPPKGIQRR